MPIGRRGSSAISSRDNSFTVIASENDSVSMRECMSLLLKEFCSAWGGQHIRFVFNKGRAEDEATRS